MIQLLLLTALLALTLIGLLIYGCCRFSRWLATKASAPVRAGVLTVFLWFLLAGFAIAPAMRQFEIAKTLAIEVLFVWQLVSALSELTTNRPGDPSRLRWVY